MRIWYLQTRFGEQVFIEAKFTLVIKLGIYSAEFDAVDYQRHYAPTFGKL